jgi:BMFP domain-containing protein YqiC
MAKKKNASRTDAVRDAVDQAFTQIPRERISELLDDLGSTAGRLRGAVDELRPATEAEIKAVRVELAELTARVAALEAAPAPSPPAPRRRAAAKPAAAQPRARKPPAAKPSKPSAAGS